MQEDKIKNIQQSCDKNSSLISGKNICSSCWISTENSIHTRRCFMSGEYCSQKTNIQHERKKLYRKTEKGITISAFVIMNFSDMSDVVYKWRVEVFVESLSKYLYFDTEKKRLYCNSKGGQIFQEEKLVKVGKINVIRSDSDPASNYVICNRICQQMQIADLVIVDVSSQNPNVFYEFGMAVALEKLILPICFSESFYKMEIPEELKKIKIKEGEELKREGILHHIGCYPWRKSLFEYYGIRFKQNSLGSEPARTKYISYDKATKEKYGFSDIQYNCFPYNEIVRNEEEDEKIYGDGENNKKIGEVIYNRLKECYNEATKGHNTLVVYTIEGFLNEDQAGLCIVNFYHSITEKMQKEQCFCGERVGVLVQDHVIPDSDKDAKRERHLLYNVGEIIHIGVNQATYLASKEKVKVQANESKDPLDSNEPRNSKKSDDSEDFERIFRTDLLIDKERKEELKRYIKEFVGNRGMIIYPDFPVYVKRITSRTTPYILKKENIGCYLIDSFCLYHIMLKNLCYTNEIVVDITNNGLQSLFWLGAAHGSEVDAITVKQELSEKERIIIEGDSQDRSRNVFDVSGLWTAYYYSHDTEGFYHQLALAQFGIEKRSKIIPADAKWRGFRRWEYLNLHDPQEEDEEDIESRRLQEKGEKIYRGWAEHNTENEAKEVAKRENMRALESYYRRRFWNAMLRYNRLRIYLPQHDDTDKDDRDPRLRAAKWDMDAVSGLTHYLSKRSVIGEYLVITLPDDVEDPMAEEVNFICIGQPVKPLQGQLTNYISDKFQQECCYKRGNHINVIHQYYGESKLYNGDLNIKVQVKGFTSLKGDAEETEEKFLRYHPWAGCEKCEQNQGGGDVRILNKYPLSIDRHTCPFIGYCAHTEIAQLILWREDGKAKGNGHFRVSLIGSSGPATFGLSSLFVDENQKLCDFLSKENERAGQNDPEHSRYLLYELQEKVRKKIFGMIIKNLKREIEKIISPSGELSHKQHRYAALVLYSVFSYLNTVLYRYFLPFLTEKDMHRINNGITMFVNSMQAARQSPFCIDYHSGIEENEQKNRLEITRKNVADIIRIIPAQVIKVIDEFKGLEVFYKVEVTHYTGGVKSDASRAELIAASYSGDAGRASERGEMFCNRNNLSNASQRDNRKVTSMEMLDEINYFMLTS